MFAGLVVGALALPSVFETLGIAMDVANFEASEAKVLSNRTKSHPRGPDSVIVKFEFTTPDGRTVEGDNRYTRISDTAEGVDRLVHHRDGFDRMKIWYDPDAPERAVIHREIALVRPIVILVFTLIAIFGGTHAILIDRRRRRLQARADEARRRREAERSGHEPSVPIDL